MGENHTSGQLIREIIQHLPEYQMDDIPSGASSQITWLIDALNKYRCLIIFDDIHEVFYGNDGKQPLDMDLCQAFEKLCRRLATEAHKSCIVAVGWEKPLGFERIEQPEFVNLSNSKAPIRTLLLKGLEFKSAQYILRDYALKRDVESWKQLVNIYRGSPLSLKLVSDYIAEKFTYNKDVSEFLSDDTIYLEKIENLICKQFDLLTRLEKLSLLIICKHKNISSINVLSRHLDNAQVGCSKTEVGGAIATLNSRGFIEFRDDQLNAPPSITKCALKVYQDLV